MSQRKAPRGRMVIRNQGKMMPTTPKQNSTRVRFWSSISVCMVRRTSTGEDTRYVRYRSRGRSRVASTSQVKTTVKWITESHSLRPRTQHYTLSTRVTSLTEKSSWGGGKRCLVKANQASPSSMSLEKRVRIRPRGVVSKNRMGLSRRRRNSLSWSTEAAFTVHCQHKEQLHFYMRSNTCKQATLKSIW